MTNAFQKKLKESDRKPNGFIKVVNFIIAQ